MSKRTGKKRWVLKGPGGYVSGEGHSVDQDLQKARVYHARQHPNQGDPGWEYVEVLIILKSPLAEFIRESEPVGPDDKLVDEPTQVSPALVGENADASS